MAIVANSLEYKKEDAQRVLRQLERALEIEKPKPKPVTADILAEMGIAVEYVS